MERNRQMYRVIHFMVRERCVERVVLCSSLSLIIVYNQNLDS